MNSPFDLQKKMALFCRTGKDPSGVGMSGKRATLYRDLIFSTIRNVLGNYYPLTSHLLGKEKWDKLVLDFFSEYPCADPQLWKMPKGLAHYVRYRSWGEENELPFLADLLDFEWLEMEIYMMPDAPLARFEENGDVLDDLLYLNPEHRIVTYSYPVFQPISLERPLQKGEYPLLCFRHPETLEAHFFSVSVFFRAVLTHLSQGSQTGSHALTAIAPHFHLPIDERLFQVGRNFLEDLITKRAILGFQR